MKLNFGTYKGCTLEEIPKSYLEWILSENVHGDGLCRRVSEYLQIPFVPKPRKPLKAQLKLMPYGVHQGKEFNLVPKEYMREYLLNPSQPDYHLVSEAMWEIIERRGDTFLKRKVGRRYKKVLDPSQIPLKNPSSDSLAHI